MFGFNSTINDVTLRRLRDAVKMLDYAAKDVGDFFHLVATLYGSSEPYCESSLISSRETSSFLTESEVFGRHNERARVIEWLEKPSSHSHMSAFCIIGAGGLGKTTLAQVIYEEITKGNHFDKTIWVCVSTGFNVEEITRKILQELGFKTDDTQSLNFLQNKVKEKVLSNKVLFILDDVWNDDQMCDWEKLIAPLKLVQEGSKILLTTRMRSVGDMLKCVLNVEIEYMFLRGLEEQAMLFLLNRYAFVGYNPDNYNDLKKIGNDIVKRLWGSPLAAKVIGSLLNSNMDCCYWRSILNCSSLINLEQAKNVADVLRLSYYHLPIYLQECFRFCSIFSQDHMFEKGSLISMWIACGFIKNQSREEVRPEDIGEEYFNHLFRKSFFERYNAYCYVMHDLMHELAQDVSKGECCRVEPNGKIVNIPDTTQHISIHENEIEQIFHLRNLRTLVVTRSEITMLDDQDPFVLPNGSHNVTLRVLEINLSRRCLLPEEIGCWIHLRYLVVLGSRSLLPSSIFKLHHLQLLAWFGEDFETTSMTNLVNIRFLILPSDEIMQNMKGVHKLTSLQVLTFFVGKERGHHIDELKTLNSLKKLSIMQIENVGDPTEAINAELSKKRSLTSLSLNWSKQSNATDQLEQIFDKLQPHPDLKELNIDYYGGRRSAIWMQNSPPLDLLSLELFNCPLWENLPSLAQMPYLWKLYLHDMSEVKELDYSYDSTTNDCPFPALEQLRCENMPKWQSWIGELSSRHGFPNLKELVIINCPNLTKLPAIPLCLSKFVVRIVRLDSLPDIYLSPNIITTAPSSLKLSLREVEIEFCQNLKSLNGFLQQENLDFQAIELLTIRCCMNLVHLPSGSFGKFKSLKRLTVYGCPKLVSVDDQRIILPGKLQTLHLGNCGKFDVQLIESASHLTSLHDLHIKNSETITGIPFSESAFAFLKKLSIKECGRLVEYSSMEYVQDVNTGNKMGASLKINELYIPHLSLLFIEPFRNLRFVSICWVEDCSGMETLPEQWLLQNSSTLEKLTIQNASSLQSLPGIMVMLTALKKLHILNAILLEEIPELPTSLIDKMIEGAGGRMLV